MAKVTITLEDLENGEVSVHADVDEITEGDKEYTNAEQLAMSAVQEIIRTEYEMAALANGQVTASESRGDGEGK